MWNAVFVLFAAVSAWLAIDLWLSRRRHAAWYEVNRDRVFHSTGWEETVVPLDAVDAAPASTRR